MHDEKLEKLLDLAYQYGGGIWHGSTHPEVREEFNKLCDDITNSIKLSNELQNTHQFYLKTKNAYCAGVTKQILDLSNYSGRGFDKKEWDELYAKKS